MRSSSRVIVGGDGADIGRVVVERGEAGADEKRVERRQVTLQIDDGLDLPLRIDPGDSLENAIRAAHVIGARHQGFAAGKPHRLADGLVVGDHHHRPAFGLDGAAPDMDDHGLAGDVGERLVRQPCRL